MSSWSTRVWDDWLKNTLPWQRHFRGTVENFTDAVQFQNVVLAEEINEPTTKKIRECGAKETELSLILGMIVSCLIFKINICKFVFFCYEKLIKMRGDYVLICKGDKCIFSRLALHYHPCILIHNPLAFSWLAFHLPCFFPFKQSKPHPAFQTVDSGVI